MVGIYSFALGALELGWILDFISVPVLNGFISAAAIVITLGQLDSLLGIPDVGDGTATIIHDLFANLPRASGVTIAIGLSGVVLLQGLQFLGQKWGKKYKIVWVLSISRAAIALLLFTGISFGVNKSRPLNDPLFELSKVKANSIVPPRAPDTALLAKVAGRSIAPLVAAALEHIAIAKAFGAKNGYIIEPSQELVYLGLTNFFNSFFSAMAVGGAMSRTAVNSESGVKSPLSGLVTAGFVLLGIYKLSPALFWIPKATLAAIIVTAVWALINIRVFGKYWRTSFTDFVASQIAFWVTLFVSAETGIGVAVGFSVLCLLVRSAFARADLDTAATRRSQQAFRLEISAAGGKVPQDTEIFSFGESVVFVNAYRVVGEVVDVVQTLHEGSPVLKRQKKEREERGERLWSVSAEKKLERLRREAGVFGEPPVIKVVVLDFTKVARLDTTGLKAMGDMKKEIWTYAGSEAELRFVGLNSAVRKRFERGGWELVDSDHIGDNVPIREGDHVVYPSVAAAVWERRGFMEEAYEQHGDGKTGA
ncbi:hypothetical protein K402DRAFT_397915 [Aulographum hederae CBS 113979]|uniref:STAS domain-containing protein n=1 Tax=Aulographum hederae CBS 113979 TaxID=1176131 RepID=A0A6G1GMJ1_9PEZI|nr:hypothetical protein K402DRAFT_397915 [Aulographum hederae CBS 113979]